MQFSSLSWGASLVLGILALTGYAEEAVPADRALIVVRLPATAALRFGETATEQTGPERIFISPALNPGKTYTYQVTAQWDEDGSPRQAIRRVVVSAGKRAVVDFNAPQPVTTSEEPPTAAPARVAPRIKPKAEPPKGGLPEPDLNPADLTPPAAPRQTEPISRTFLFTYDATVKELRPGKTAHVWLPLAQSSAEQDVKIVSHEVPTGAKTNIGTEKQYGNKMFHVEAKGDEQGEIPIKVVFRVTRREVQTSAPHGLLIKPDPEEKIARFLEPDAVVPVGGKPLELVKGKKVPADQFAAAKLLYDVVNQHMTYSKKGTGWGRGDAAWACDSKYGNCTDFHSLFISLARAQKIPSKFVMGFPLPAKRGAGDISGYHCWAWFLPEGKGWIPVDISEANQNPSRQAYYFGSLTENRVQFTKAGDINLVPRQSGEPLNYFIYPYVEVDDMPYPAEKVARHFGYQDEPPTSDK